MEDGKNWIWRVSTTYGYRTLCFDFNVAEDAAEFIKTCLMHFNPVESEDQKKLSVSMSCVNPTEEKEDD